MKAAEIAEVTGGKVVAGDGETIPSGLAIDSRALQAGQLFVPLKGESYDGEAFVADALRAGAAGAFVTKWNREVRKQIEPFLPEGGVLLKVKNGLEALHSLASAVRDKLDVPVIAITGSTGKTTTRDILAAMLRTKLNVVSSERNLNNEIGLPATIISADAGTEALVLEMAMRGPGQIRDLCAIARPTIGLVTNVGKTHFEFFGSEERIAEAKGELVESVPGDGLVVLNEDDYWTHKLRGMAKARVITYGTRSSADVRAEEIEVDKEGRASFFIKVKGARRSLRVPILGRHNVYNTCAAAAVALNLGLSLREIAEGMAGTSLSGMRMEVFTTADEITVLNDAYNANPTSMIGALETLEAIEAAGKKIAVLGDMMELGTMTDVAHFQVGEAAARARIDLLITVGRYSARTGDGARVGGMDEGNVRHCPTTSEAAKMLHGLVSPGDVVLVKASRAMRLEDVVESLA